jgi:hypothetical protein
MKTSFVWPRAPRGRTVPLLVTLSFLFALAPLALAQTTKPKKKKPPATEPAPDTTADTPPPPPPPADEDTTKKPDKAATSAASENPPPAPATDTKEDPGKKYYFVGGRYRLTVIPQFMVNLFVNEGATFVSHSIGAELDMRKDNQSTIPWIAVQTFGFGDTIFLQKNGTGGDGNPGNWSVVNSSLNGLFLGLDENWSVPMDSDHHWDFEFGFGVGIGFIFGTLHNNWVTPNANGPLQAHGGSYPPGSNGRFSQCQTMSDGPGCALGDHNNPSVAKVGNYSEPNWFGGGSIPVLFPHIAIPQFGIRWEPVKQFEMRLQTGFSLTGFFFGISGDYGLEKTGESSSGIASRRKRTETY